MSERRVTTAVRLTPELHEDLVAAAKDHGLSINWLVSKAIEEFLSRLLPSEEWRVTKARDERNPE